MVLSFHFFLADPRHKVRASTCPGRTLTQAASEQPCLGGSITSEHTQKMGAHPKAGLGVFNC